MLPVLRKCLLLHVFNDQSLETGRMLLVLSARVAGCNGAVAETQVYF